MNNRKMGLVFIAGSIALCAVSALFGLLVGSFKVFFGFTLALGGLPGVVAGAIIFLGIFKDFEWQSACILYFGTMLGGYELAKFMHGYRELPYVITFALSLAVTLALFYRKKLKEQEEKPIKSGEPVRKDEPRPSKIRERELRVQEEARRKGEQNGQDA